MGFEPTTCASSNFVITYTANKPPVIRKEAEFTVLVKIYTQFSCFEITHLKSSLSKI